MPDPTYYIRNIQLLNVFRTQVSILPREMKPSCPSVFYLPSAPNNKDRQLNLNCPLHLLKGSFSFIAFNLGANKRGTKGKKMDTKGTGNSLQALSDIYMIHFKNPSFTCNIPCQCKCRQTPSHGYQPRFTSETSPLWNSHLSNLLTILILKFQYWMPQL